MSTGKAVAVVGADFPFQSLVRVVLNEHGVNGYPTVEQLTFQSLVRVVLNEHSHLRQFQVC